MQRIQIKAPILRCDRYCYTFGWTIFSNKEIITNFVLQPDSAKELGRRGWGRKTPIFVAKILIVTIAFSVRPNVFVTVYCREQYFIS